MNALLSNLWFFAKNSTNAFPENGCIKKLPVMVPSESSQELSNEWSCQ
jgi:hypothetical protein